MTRDRDPASPSSRRGLRPGFWDLNTTLALLALLLLLATIALFVRDQNRRDRLERYLALGDEADLAQVATEAKRYAVIRNFVKQHYVEEVDFDDFLFHALAGGVSSLDPHSNLYRKEDFEQLQQQTDGYYRGIGVIIDRDAPALTVLYPGEGSPAMAAGLRPGDRIVSIDDEPVDPKDPDLAIERIKGKPQTKVSLRIERGADVIPIDVHRERIDDPPVRRAVLLDPDHGIGYVSLLSFTSGCAESLRRAIRRLRTDLGVRALVLDLRFNQGGILPEAIDIAGFFIAEGTLLSTRSRGIEQERWSATPERAHFAGMPLAVLLEENSASASEIVAGALQDHGAAVLIGERSYGKGVVQSNQTLPELDVRIKLTTSYYYTPNGRNFERHGDRGWGGGIYPDVLMPHGADRMRELYGYLKTPEIPRDLVAAVEAYLTSRGRPLPDEAILRDDPAIAAALKSLRGEPIGAIPLPADALRAAR